MTPIYVSSSCVNNRAIKDSVDQLAQAGFKYIELSGGTNYYDNWLADLLELKAKYDLTYRGHNYFPPPQAHFFLNLASDNPDIYQQSITHVELAIEISAKLGGKKFGLHAGFLIDPDVKQAGKKISLATMQNEQNACQNFGQRLAKLQQMANEYDVELYVENNVLSAANYQTYQCSPFLLVDHQGLIDLQAVAPFKFLLDVAHLKVSCNSLGLDFKTQYKALAQESDYLHISDNNGLADQNLGLEKDSELYELLSNTALNNKDITLEIYNGIPAIKEAQALLEGLRLEA